MNEEREEAVAKLNEELIMAAEEIALLRVDMSETRDAVELFKIREELRGAAEEIASLRANVNESKDAVELFKSMLQKS